MMSGLLTCLNTVVTSDNLRGTSAFHKNITPISIIVNHVIYQLGCHKLL